MPIDTVAAPRVAMRSLRTWFLCLSLCGSCVSVSYQPLNTPPKTLLPRRADQVELFTTAKPPYAYVEVGMFEARSDFSDEQLAVMREKAAAIGCDGLVLLGSADVVSGSMWVKDGSGRGSVHTTRGYRGTCIVREAAASEATPAASSDQPASSATDLLVTAPEAVIRSAPFRVAPILASVRSGDRVPGGGDGADGWRRVRLPDGRVGFVRAEDTKVVVPAVKTPSKTAAAASSPLQPASATTPAPCDPPCSPGYACEVGTCVALCNPACGPEAICGADRTCRPR